jgi:PPP family 3-phenylpropionic acid transporter
LADLGYGKFQIGLFWALGVFAEVIFFYFQSKVLSRVDAEVVLQAAFGVGVVRFILIAFLPITSVLIFAQILHAGTFAAHHSAATTLGGLCAGWIWELSQPRDVFVMSAFACGMAGMAIQKLRPRRYPTKSVRQD